jgi:hypothetical protein
MAIQNNTLREKSMNKRIGLILMIALSLNIGACTSTTPPKEELKVERSNVVTVSVTVEKIDLQKRMVTLRGPEGNLRTLHVGKEVVNLPQVRVGDKVEIDYAETLAVRMAEPGEVRNEVKAVVGKAKPGQKPGYVEETETTVTATILALDKVKETATLKLADGNMVVVQVQDPANFDKVKVGDTIVITYTNGLAIAVRSAKK